MQAEVAAAGRQPVQTSSPVGAVIGHHERLIGSEYPSPGHMLGVAAQLPVEALQEPFHERVELGVRDGVLGGDALHVLDPGIGQQRVT